MLDNQCEGNIIMMPKVTIIIPVYNAGQYIEQCLNSVLRQTMTDLEIICIDDCSSDDSADRIKQMAIHDYRLVLIHNEKNLGAGETRNKGIRLAKGKYFFFLDADDFLDINAIEKLYQCAETHELQLCFCSHIIYQMDGCTRRGLQTTDVFLRKYQKQVFSWKDVQRFLYQNIFCVPWNRLYLTDFVRDSSIRFPALRNSEDFFFGEAIVTEAERMGVVESEIPLVYYRLGREGQISSTVGQNPYCMLEAVRQLYVFLQTNHRLESVIKSYHTVALEMLIFPIRFAKCPEQIIENTIEYGFPEIGMCGLEAGDFTNSACYKKYRDFMEGRLSDFNIFMTSVEQDWQKLDEISLFMKRHKDKKIALWGMGKRGQALSTELKKRGSEFDYDIDVSSTKAGERSREKIYKYEEITEKLDYIMITNAMYFEEIFLQCKKADDYCKIIDLDTFFRCDMTIEECMV